MSEIKVMNNDEIRDFCIKKDLKIFELEQQLQQKENIIKEVREYATQHMMELAKRKGINGEENGAIYVAVADLLEILEKGDEK